MGSIRDPGRAAMEAEELARARLSAAQEVRQAQARRARERALGGSLEARRELAADYAAVNPVEARKVRVTMAPGVTITAFIGEGPPPADGIPVAVAGDNYLDAESGDLYTLED